MIIATKTRQTRVLYTVLITGGALLIVLLLCFLFLHPKAEAPITQVGAISSPTWVLSFGSFTIPITIADTPVLQEQGLSGTLSLPAESGKLFIFDKPDFYGFWMKDMAYSLDIVWIDETMKIVGITKDVFPDTYPQVFYPPEKVRFVLEVNAGFSTTHNLSENQLLSLMQETHF